MAPGRTLDLHVGMIVIGYMGDILGSIKEVRVSDFLVERTLARDVYVPFYAVRQVLDNLVALKIAGNQIDEMHWPSP